MIEEYGVVLLQMMEHAGLSLGVVARQLLGGNAAGRKVLVLVGRGNNGGGGLAAARQLSNAAAQVTIVLSGMPGAFSGVAEHQLAILQRMDLQGSDGPLTEAALHAQVDEADIIIDALIGYSLSDALREPIAGMIRTANAAHAPRLALDIPSGLDGERGIPFDPVISATATLTLAWPKAELLDKAARSSVGELFLADIGVPPAVYHAVGVTRGALFGAGPIVRIRPVAQGWEPLAPTAEINEAAYCRGAH